MAGGGPTMKTEMPNCISSTPSREALAKHEAGHLLIGWLLGRTPGGAAIVDGVGGVTVDASPEPEYQHERLLRMLAGIVFEDDCQTLDQIVENCHTPEAFDEHSDAYWVCKTALELAGQWQMTVDDILAGFTGVMDDILQEYGAVAAEIADVLFERGAISPQDCIALYGEFDARFGMAGRSPKSAIVCRKITKHISDVYIEGQAQFRFLESSGA